MQLYVLLAIIFAVLALALFITKRRFGLPTVMLAAGYVVSMQWADTVTLWMIGLGLNTAAVPLSVIVGSGLILLPGLVLVSSGGVAKKMPLRVVGALLFGLVGCAFVAEPLLQNSVLGYDDQQAFQLFMNNTSLIVGVGILAAWIDLVLTKTPKPPKDEGKH